MRTISSNIAKQTFGHVLESAQHTPIIIEKHRHATAVILSMAEYTRLTQNQAVVKVQASVPSTVPKIRKTLPLLRAALNNGRLQPSGEEMIQLVAEADYDA